MSTADRKRDEAPGRSRERVPGGWPELPLILGEVSDGVTIQDAAGRLIYANHAAARASGYASVEEMLAAAPGDFLRRFELRTESGGIFALEQLPGRRALRGEAVAATTLRALDRQTGEERWSMVSALPVLDARGRVRAVINIFRDITERRRAEERLRFLLDASALLVETLDYQDRLARLAAAVVPRLADWCAIDIVQEDGRVRRLAVVHQDPAKVRWAYELQSRYPPDWNAPAGVPNVLRTGRAELYPEIPDAILETAAQDAEHLRLLRGVGITSAMIVPLAARGRTLGALSFVAAESNRRYGADDLAFAEELARRAALAIDNARLYAELREAHVALEQQAAELEQATAELEAANEELLERTAEAESANRAKANFLAMMSHELRTPLNAISGYVDLLELGVHGPLTAAQEQDLRRIRFSQQHLLGIINEVLSFARLETGRLELAIADVPISSALLSVAELIEPQMQAKQLAFEYRPGDAAVTVRADLERLHQIVLNLLSNAIKFTPSGGRVILEWDADDSLVRIRVRDTGRGIPADRLQVIFEPFVQVDTALTRDSSGVGLGLAISRDLARAMGGELVAESTPGRGSTFTLRLPRRPAARPR